MGSTGAQDFPKIRKLGGFSNEARIQQFSDNILDKTYQVFLIDEAGHRQIFKRAEANEIAAYQQLQKMTHFTDQQHLAVPVLQRVVADATDEKWLLLSFFEGEDMRSASGRIFEVFGEALATIVNAGVAMNDLPADPISSVFERLEQKLLPHSIAARGLAAYKKRRCQMPLTFTNDDLLPINVLWRKDEVCLIDWGYGRRGTYVADLARFLAFTGFSKEVTDGYPISEIDGRRAIAAFYQGLSSTIKSQRRSGEFWMDLKAEWLFQYLLALWHLPQIIDDELQTPLEQQRYRRLCKLVAELEA